MNSQQMPVVINGKSRTATQRHVQYLKILHKKGTQIPMANPIPFQLTKVRNQKQNPNSNKTLRELINIAMHPQMTTPSLQPKVLSLKNNRNFNFNQLKKRNFNAAFVQHVSPPTFRFNATCYLNTQQLLVTLKEKVNVTVVDLNVTGLMI